MSEKRNYGFPGCTPEQRSLHRHWCYKHGHKPYSEYRSEADSVIENRQKTIIERSAAHNQKRKEECKRPEWMPEADWKAYGEYERRSIELGFPPIPPEQYMGQKAARRTKLHHHSFSPTLNTQFLRCNRRRRYNGLPAFTPEQYIEWLAAPQHPNGKRIKPKKPKAPKGGLVFNRPKEDIIMKILMATKPMRSQDECSRTRKTDSCPSQELGNDDSGPSPADRIIPPDDRGA